ncbi:MULTISPECIES: ferredoxin [unclassified Polynucleobacter]|uniref:(2Fe-2S) ferredoxin domain-containing protein n=1 Tax=unclassified Polynucleobacter TaxID=2640945 RepID=UPI001F1F46D6|nr:MULTISPECIES: (2Fe-2S) ferredoxin domain-containing protein [unclassified Polynucleobacter]MCE7526450.1 (2Fe-2S) ferredoxin domain-containing protein [Polynucleobacter sp. IMCC 30228]MCE7529736.1 (2Fe-2S) ferredoxin domain-containing protein [Polynucleobacter sp. IMCC 29146]
MYFQHHLFFCLNERSNGENCCAQHGAQGLFDFAKRRIKELGLAGVGQVRVNKAGCLDRCDHGPVLVIYPAGVWYTVIDTSDIEEIIQTHLIQGQIVERLQLV